MLNKESVSSILIPYDCIVDEDTGLLRVIRDNYSNDTVFYMDRIETDDDIEQLVLYEKYENPLELILKPDYQDKAEDFYNQFIEEEYENILTNSFITKLHKFIFSVKGSNLGFITLRADNDRQRKSLEYLFGEETNIETKPLSKIDLEEFDIIFLKRAKEIKDLGTLSAKSIYLMDYNFNFENDRDDENPLPTIEYTLLLIKYHNVLNVVSPYERDYEEYEDEEEEDEEEIEEYDNDF